MVQVVGRAWNEEQFCRGGWNEDNSFKGHVVTRALGKGMFHCYLKLVIVVNSIPKDIGQWCEQCYCHEDLHGQEVCRPRNKLRRSVVKEISRCPMVGKRMPELVV